MAKKNTISGNIGPPNFLELQHGCYYMTNSVLGELHIDGKPTTNELTVHNQWWQKKSKGIRGVE